MVNGKGKALEALVKVMNLWFYDDKTQDGAFPRCKNTFVPQVFCCVANNCVLLMKPSPALRKGNK